jgi:hypothetical protein
MPRLPWPARALNRVGRIVERKTSLLPFAAGPLMERAARSARLSDFAPDAQFTDGLDQLCRSIERDVHHDRPDASRSGIVVPSMNSLFSSIHSTMTDAVDQSRARDATD